MIIALATLGGGSTIVSAKSEADAYTSPTIRSRIHRKNIFQDFRGMYSRSPNKKGDSGGPPPESPYIERVVT
jgi:hypothetical protein